MKDLGNNTVIFNNQKEFKTIHNFYRNLFSYIDDVDVFAFDDNFKIKASITKEFIKLFNGMVQYPFIANRNQVFVWSYFGSDVVVYEPRNNTFLFNISVEDFEIFGDYDSCVWGY